jgi:CheY-like chemotaxis protein
MPIKVVLAEDTYLVREAVRRLLETEPDIDLVAVCEDYDLLLAAIGTAEPELVLTDIRMPPTGTDGHASAAAPVTHDVVGPTVTVSRRLPRTGAGTVPAAARAPPGPGRSRPDGRWRLPAASGRPRPAVTGGQLPAAPRTNPA